MYCPLCGHKIGSYVRRTDNGMTASMGANIECTCGAHVLLKFFFSKDKSVVDVIGVHFVATNDHALVQH